MKKRGENRACAFALVELTAVSKRAFTLVELLVVIGIIALLIGVLLPVLSGVQMRGRDIKCQSNLRQIVQAIYGYCAENRGTMPWGLVYNNSKDKVDPNPWSSLNTWENDPFLNPNFHYFSWASLIGKYMGNRGSALTKQTASGSGKYTGVDVPLRTLLPGVFQCPEAAQIRQGPVSYVMNMVVAISPLYEVVYAADATMGQGTHQLRPPNQSLMLKETALVWDTGIRPDFDENDGYLVGADIDYQQRFWAGAAFPQWRYFQHNDPYNNIAIGGQPGMGNNRPVKLGWPSLPFKNIEPQLPADLGGDPTAGQRWPYQGNLRFRHNKDTTCNVGFADGSVRQFTCKMNPDKSVDQQNHNALRRYFMIKWPAGTVRGPGRP